MKKILLLFICLVVIILLVSCGISSKENPITDIELEELKEKYPEYFEMSDFKGIEVYVWQMAENSYRCGMLPGTNRLKTNEEILALQHKSLSIEEAKAILDEIGVENEKIIVIPVSQPCSSFVCEITEKYEEYDHLFK